MGKGKQYGQFCPVAKAAEILAVRWTPLIIRELLCGSHRFNDLKRGVPLMSPSLLSTRLRELEDSGIVRREPIKGERGHEYCLTAAGEALRAIIEAQGLWAQKHLEQRIANDDLDPSLLMWDIRRNIDHRFQHDKERFSVQFELAGVPAKQQRWWILFEGEDADLCIKDPGRDIDLYVSSHIRTLTEIWMGVRKLPESIAAGDCVLDGSREACRGFPKWFLLSHFAKTAI